MFWSKEVGMGPGGWRTFPPADMYSCLFDCLFLLQTCLCLFHYLVFFDVIYCFKCVSDCLHSYWYDWIIWIATDGTRKPSNTPSCWLSWNYLSLLYILKSCCIFLFLFSISRWLILYHDYCIYICITVWAFLSTDYGDGTRKPSYALSHWLNLYCVYWICHYVKYLNLMKTTTGRNVVLVTNKPSSEFHYRILFTYSVHVSSTVFFLVFFRVFG